MNLRSVSIGRDVAALIGILTLIIIIAIFLTADFKSSAQVLVGKTVPNYVLSGTISGRVFQDYNGNGQYDTSGGTAAAPTAVDVGVGGVTVSAYDSGGVLRGSAVSAALTGIFSITATGTGPYRVEFTTIPAGYAVSARSTDSVAGGSATNAGSTEQFVADGITSNVNLALDRAQDYCEDNPDLGSQTYAVGDVNDQNSIFTVPYTSGSTRTTGGNPITDFIAPGNTSLATSNQVGTTFGLAYHRATRRVFASAFMKKHAKFGPGGTGAIYQVDRNTGTVSEYVNLNTVFGANTAGANPHDTANYNTDNGQATWDAVGKVAFGGMTISDDQANLYVMNLSDRKLYRIPTSGTLDNTTIQSVAFPTSMPNCAAAVEVRPFAVTWYQGSVYVGAVCSRETSAGTTSTNLRAYVYRVDPATFTFVGTPDVNIQLNYSRAETDPGLSADWLNWRTTFQRLDANHFIYPQPMLTDIEFDNGNMILGLRDRDGDQTGLNNASNPNNSGELQKGITAGDMIRLCGSPNTWTLESNGRCNGIGNAPQGTGEGPGNGEYYYQDNYHPNGTPHDEVSVGGLMQVPGHQEIVATVFDPVYLPTDNIFDSGGFRWFVNSTGAQNRGYLVFNTGEFGKSNGMGNVQAFCSAAPIEIGNRVWRDSNANGVQDAGEPVVSGATVHLYQGSTLIGTSVTDANGEYYFVSSSTADGNTTDNIGQINGGIQPNTNYQIRLDLTANYLPGGPLQGLSVTTANQTSQLGDDDSSDSDAVSVTNPAGSPAGKYPVISVTTGGAGFNDHTLDIGLVLAPTAAKVTVSGRISTVIGSGIRNIIVNLVEADGTTHIALTNSFGYYQFEDIEAAQLVVVSVYSRNYSFRDPVRAIKLSDNLAGVDFVSSR